MEFKTIKNGEKSRKIKMEKLYGKMPCMLCTWRRVIKLTQKLGETICVIMKIESWLGKRVGVEFKKLLVGHYHHRMYGTLLDISNNILYMELEDMKRHDGTPCRRAYPLSQISWFGLRSSIVIPEQPSVDSPVLEDKV